MMRRAIRLALPTAAAAVCLFVNDGSSSTGRSTLIAQADARVGRPLTPVSVAGVHRRAARRAYHGGGYYGPGAAAATVGAVAAGAATVGAAAAGAYVAEPAAQVYPPSAPGFVHDAIPVEPGASATVTDPATGRTCTIQPNGYHWCWTP